ncbi:SRPBCC domain-containing protein [Galbibacter sp. EGI 63066]|uniref:SRPBCC domain-containing protein n=1 Tax=Galbibacter sp. EGI 63066 TaxID=2993559 RepID=UPI002248C384|nr:SRPBCC domain-containing protein [Galbibacter sp. EGI 63066]MCX2681567.1 SRPBCC domain-containing protein [Galbibacter sp. EGI 63066]
MKLKELNFSISINASKDKVWEALWNDKSYREWSSAFCEGSHAVTDWEEGSKVLFLDNNGSGMYSKIAQCTTNEFMSFEHQGIVKDGVEQPQDRQTKEWAGAKEEYRLSGSNGETLLEVRMHSDNEWAGYFNKTFPKALERVKQLSEK